ncbi:hypothetical protein DNTS_003306 [Danionella cerebrum]|uniref:phosphatidylinositol-3,5-bisphosphate 3-phosphatase n=1 Tax=Danionella cerebrum TaxID=2873325 RepID=A0A553MVP1_9TELE|nr:hypothetical protein DNTS_003306 [Danionella translucida]
MLSQSLSGGELSLCLEDGELQDSERRRDKSPSKEKMKHTNRDVEREKVTERQGERAPGEFECVYVKVRDVNDDDDDAAGGSFGISPSTLCDLGDRAMSHTHSVSCSMLNCFGEEGPPSLEYIQARDLFPQKELLKEDEALQVPFPVLQGECVEFLGRADDAIPLRLIESVESREMFQLHIICKDSKVMRCGFSTLSQCEQWQKRLNRAIMHPSRLEELFALAYHAWSSDEEQHNCRAGDHVLQRMELEVRRMGFDMQNAWRVSEINTNYKLCSSYPQKLLVPVWITDKELESVASFRSWKRIPVVVYRHQRNGAVLARCSQPEISWWGWRNSEDEYLVSSIARASHIDRGLRSKGEGAEPSDCDFDSSLTVGPAPDAQKLLILDARSYTAAVANRAKGGGCECEEYYPKCEVMFMGMANIHSIRNSFQSLRAVCSQIPDPGSWLSSLESTRWLQHLSVMLKAAALVSSAVEREARSVLVHCSDGWDRTPQIIALAKILLDPFYRTMEGFQVLVETDWLDFGHKFADRCGHQERGEDSSEQCPVFLQWLDCVHQLIKQFPCFFQFNEAFLVKLVQHTYSCLYGTFLCNNAKERHSRNVQNRTCSVWSLLRSGNKNFLNLLYIPCHETVLQPVCHTRALHLWTAVYLPSSSSHSNTQTSAEDIYLCPSSPLSSSSDEDFTAHSLERRPKTRSMENLVAAVQSSVTLTRTSSDSNLNKHCQELRPALELSQNAPMLGPESNPKHCSSSSCKLYEDDLEAEPCLTTQPLPFMPRPIDLNKAMPPMNINEPLPAVEVSPLPLLEPRVETISRNLRYLSGGFAQTENIRSDEQSAKIQSRDLTEGKNGARNMELVSVKAARRLISQSPLTDLSLIGSQWDSVQGLVQSGSFHGRRLANKLLRPQNGGSNASSFFQRDLLFHSSPAHLDDDGLPVAVDAVQTRLRQIEAGYKQEVEALRRQVKELQIKLERKETSAATAESDLDYEDDITCLRESISSDEEDSLSNHSEDRLSEGSWDRVERKDTEVTRWVPDHMASHCFGCDSEFWIAKRRHHCRNCGNVFCKDCCHLKLPIPDQHLYDPELVCNSCYDLLLESRAREIRAQQLKKAIATASS